MTSLRLRPGKATFRPRVEALEERCLLSVEFRTIDGSHNNEAHIHWGQAGTDLLRVAPAAYGDGISSPAGPGRPSARVVSDIIFNQRTLDTVNDRNMSDFVAAFGQFLDHDLSLTVDAILPNGQPAAPLPISVPAGDPYFDPLGTGTQIIPFNRSRWDSTTGTSQNNPRQQPNEVTSYLDGSQIYGSDAVRADTLRAHVGGRLLTSDGNMLPFNTFGLPNDNNGPFPDNQLFVAGDVRANENIQLTALQTLFMREHNRIADQIHAGHPQLDDETIYQLARRYVGAELQVITYNEFLPALLGPNALPPYAGYDATANAGIVNEFSTAAFRFGHSGVNNTVPRLDNDGNPIPEGPVDLTQASFNPTLFDPSLPNHEGDIDPILKGAASDNLQEIDVMMVDDIRNLLFGPPGSGGIDLGAFDVQRGRDHGLPDYNATRVAYGLDPVTGFDQITSNINLQQRLAAVYGNVNNVDLFVGGMAEDHAPGASVGPLFKAIMVTQFEQLRDGDRFWYQNVFSGSDLANLESTTLADVIRRDTSLTNLQDDVFFFDATSPGLVAVATAVQQTPVPGSGLAPVAAPSSAEFVPQPAPQAGATGFVGQGLPQASSVASLAPAAVGETVTDPVVVTLTSPLTAGLSGLASALPPN